jgi:prokaryotic ubiquitin-like protein Pup
MATRDTGGQSQSGKARRDAEVEDAATPEVDPEVAERVEQVSEEVDDLLDEIDSVLEENAEEFIRGYVQKGGE